MPFVWELGVGSSIQRSNSSSIFWYLLKDKITSFFYSNNILLYVVIVNNLDFPTTGSDITLWPNGFTNSFIWLFLSVECSRLI